MPRKRQTIFQCFLLSLVMLLAAVPTLAQQQTPGTPAPASPTTYKMTTPIPPSIAIPDKVETRFGTLNFFDGFPDKASTEKLYDNLDFQRAVQAYLLGLPAVSQLANRNAILELGPANTTVPIFEQLMDSRTVELTANNNTPYTWFWLDLRKGPLVLEVPPKVLGLIDDMWYHWIVDVGITGPDKGQGGKYLLLPPGYKGEVPKGYYVVRSGDVQRLGRLAQLPRERRPEAGRRYGEEVHQDLSAVAGRPIHHAELREHVRQAVQHGRPGRLLLLGVAQSGRAGRTDRLSRPDHARLLGVHRYPEGQAVRAGCTDEEDPDRSRRGGRRDRPRDRLSDPDRRTTTTIRTAPGGRRSSAATSSRTAGRAEPGRLRHVSSSLPPASRRRWKRRWSARVRTTPGRPWTPSGNPLDGGKNYKLHLPPNIPVKTSGRSSSMTLRPARCCRPISNSRASAARPRDSWSTPTVRWTSTSDRRPRPARRTTGCRPSPARAGSPSCASMVRWSRGSNKTWRPGEIELQP